MSLQRIAAYITGHGFGHATRSIEFLEALRLRRPGLQIHVRSMASEAVLRHYFRGPIHHAPVRLDAGAMELGILDVDVPSTLTACREVMDDEARLIESEVRFLRETAIQAVYFDIPALAARIAAEAGIPSIAMGNFSWDFIYADYLDRFPGFAPVVDRVRANYAHTTLALQLPLGHQMTVFPRRVSIPLVAKRSTMTRSEVRAALAIRDDEPMLLLGLRGSVVAALGPVLDRLPFTIVSFGGTEASGSRRVRILPESWQTRFTEVLAASDIVLSKPGYGIVSECLANGTALLHLKRRDFAEKDYLIAGMEGLLANAALDPDDLSADKVKGLAMGLMAGPALSGPVDATGAEVAVDHLLRVSE